MDWVIEEQRASDLDAIEAILDRAFGSGRRQLTTYRFRDGVSPVEGLSLVARRDDELVGTIRFWPVAIEGDDGRVRHMLLLGPIAVEPELKGLGIGKALMREGLARAHALGHALAILVGDLDYYSRVGFARVPAGTLVFPGWVDDARVLYRELAPGAFDGVAGRVLAAVEARALQKRRL